MGIALLQATGSHFRDAGMCVPACSRDWRAGSSMCITTVAMWVSCTFLSRGNMLGKPTAHNSWGAVEVGWEARAMRKHDEEQAKIAREQGLPVRARIQNEAGTAHRRRSTEIRASEQARQWDRQRHDIHPAEVAEHLARIEAKKLAPATLPPAVPDAEPDRPVHVLPVRYVQRE